MLVQKGLPGSTGEIRVGRGESGSRETRLEAIVVSVAQNGAGRTEKRVRSRDTMEGDELDVAVGTLVWDGGQEVKFQVRPSSAHWGTDHWDTRRDV